ncbi:MAG: hypothetical protein WCJ67_12630 [Thermoleophilia bacterium]
MVSPRGAGAGRVTRYGNQRVGLAELAPRFLAYKEALGLRPSTHSHSQSATEHAG